MPATGIAFSSRQYCSCRTLSAIIWHSFNCRGLIFSITEAMRMPNAFDHAYCENSAAANTYAREFVSFFECGGNQATVAYCKLGKVCPAIDFGLRKPLTTKDTKVSWIKGFSFVILRLLAVQAVFPTVSGTLVTGWIRDGTPGILRWVHRSVTIDAQTEELT